MTLEDYIEMTKVIVTNPVYDETKKDTLIGRLFEAYGKSFAAEPEGKIGDLNSEKTTPAPTNQNSPRELTPAERGRVGFWREFDKYLNSVGNPFEFNQTNPDWFYSYKNIDLVKFSRNQCHLSVDLNESNHTVRVAYYIPQDKSVFDQLCEKRDEIERAAGFMLNWDRLDGKKAAKISYGIPGLDFDNTSNYPALMAEVVDKVKKMKNAVEGIYNTNLDSDSTKSGIGKGNPVKWNDLGLKNGDKLVCQFDWKEGVVVDVEKRLVLMNGESEPITLSGYCRKVNNNQGYWQGTMYFTFNGKLLVDIAREKGLLQ